jgi:hypothetical protein
VTPANILGPLIKRSRLKAGLTHEQVCNRASEHGIKMNPEHLIEIEEQQRRLPDGVMYALLEVLGATMAEIEQAFKDGEKELGLE